LFSNVAISSKNGLFQAIGHYASKAYAVKSPDSSAGELATDEKSALYSQLKHMDRAHRQENTLFQIAISLVICTLHVCFLHMPACCHL